jgi:hypothetical protein
LLILLKINNLYPNLGIICGNFSSFLSNFTIFG